MYFLLFSILLSLCVFIYVEFLCAYVMINYLNLIINEIIFDLLAKISW